MGWIDHAWPMFGAISLTLGLIYLLVWVRQPRQYGYLQFFVFAAAVAVFSLFELRLMRAATPDEYAATLRWAHVPVFVVVVSLVGFVLLYLRSGRLWLAGAACGLRAVALVLNFVTGVNVNFAQVTAMRPVPVWGGESIYLPVGVPNPYVIVAQLSNLFLIWFVADASISLWRRGDADARRRAVVVGGSMIFSAVAAAVLAALLNTGLARIPTMLSVLFLGVVVAMAYELGGDVIAASRLTARLRLSEERLRESEQRLQLAAGAGELGLWEWNVAGEEVWMTPECRALFGYRGEERIGVSRLLEAVHPEDRAGVERNVRALLPARGNDFEQEFRIVLPDGHVRWVAFRGRIERDEGGAARMRGAVHDVTARRQAEERFRTLIEAAPTALLMIDAEGLIVFANDRAAAMFGYAPEELAGRSVETLVPSRFLVSHRAHRQAYRQEPRARAMGSGRELVALRKDGTELPVEVGLNPMQTAEGRFVLASVADISERKQNEQEAARQRDEMAHLARVAMLGELSGSLAHELNQPLAAILSNAQAAQRFLARDPPQLDRVTEILTDIVKSDRRAGAVITRLRSMLKKEEARHQPVDMNEVVQEVLALMRSDFLNRGVNLHTKLAAQLPLVSGDRVQLQQVLLNLLINACDAMAESDPPRDLVVRSESEPGGKIKVSVADRGTGIPPDHLERVFEPFVTTKVQGLGLGLAVCRSIVRAHNGRLWAANNPDGGAILSLELPANGILPADA
jgi:two-component system, LuxR family, sensor kinase FixL